jgi:hypothetical protein
MLQTTALKLVYHIQYGAHGWQESHVMPQTTFAGAKVKAALVVDWRAASIAVGGTLTWARLSYIDRPRFTVAVIDRPRKPLVYAGSTFTGAIEDPYTCLHARYETADGRWANRLFRGVPDLIVSELELQTVDTTILAWPFAAPLPDITDKNTAKIDIFRGMMRVIANETRYCKTITMPNPTAVPPVVGSFELLDWNEIVYRKIANRNTGRPFGITRGRAPKRAAVVV